MKPDIPSRKQMFLFPSLLGKNRKEEHED